VKGSIRFPEKRTSGFMVQKASARSIKSFLERSRKQKFKNFYNEKI